MKGYYKLIVVLLLSQMSYGQNELYVKGDNSSGSTELYVKDRMSSGKPTLYVKGSFTNAQGVVVNSGSMIEVTTDFTNTAAGTTAYYSSSGEEKFTGTGMSTISGTLNGSVATENCFNVLKVSKATGSMYVNLGSDLHVKDSVVIISGIVRTDVSSHGNDGGAYPNKLFLQSTLPDKLVSNSVGNTNYVEGKLQRSTATGSTYFFPVGISPSTLDGMEPFNITPTEGSGNVLGYLVPTSQSYSAYIFQDIAGHPGDTTVVGVTPVSDCNGGPDGIIDAFLLNNDFDLDWVVTNPSGGSITKYNITVVPGTALDGTVSYVYTCTGATMKYMSRNGMPGGVATTTSPGPDSVYIDGTTKMSSLNGLGLSPTNYTLSDQVSFSSFKMHGPSNTGGALPVTLMYLKARGIDNSYIRLDWATASEYDNKGFEVERSEDGRSFILIDFVSGAGTTNEVVNYTDNDYAVEQGITYYYRLKQIDNNGKYEYSNIVTARLEGGSAQSVDIYPNPALSGAAVQVEIMTARAMTASLRIYDVLGNVVSAEKLQLGKGMNKSTLGVGVLAAGTYMVYVILDEEVITKKLTITK